MRKGGRPRLSSFTGGGSGCRGRLAAQGEPSAHLASCSAPLGGRRRRRPPPPPPSPRPRPARPSSAPTRAAPRSVSPPRSRTHTHCAAATSFSHLRRRRERGSEGRRRRECPDVGAAKVGAGRYYITLRARPAQPH